MAEGVDPFQLPRIRAYQDKSIFTVPQHVLDSLDRAQPLRIPAEAPNRARRKPPVTIAKGPSRVGVSSGSGWGLWWWREKKGGVLFWTEVLLLVFELARTWIAHSGH